MSKNTLRVYDYAKEVVAQQGYIHESKWVESVLSTRLYGHITKKRFFRECVWVIFCSGFKAEIVQDKWQSISLMFNDFEIDMLDTEDVDDLIKQSPIKNRQKLKAIIRIAKILTSDFIDNLRNLESIDEILLFLKQLPYIGEVTVWHLMRNIGIDCFKPDRHIVKLALILSLRPSELFQQILDAGRTEYIGVADVILWRACAILGSASRLVDESLHLIDECWWKETEPC